MTTYVKLDLSNSSVFDVPEEYAKGLVDYLCAWSVENDGKFPDAVYVNAYQLGLLSASFTWGGWLYELAEYEGLFLTRVLGVEIHSDVNWSVLITAEDITKDGYKLGKKKSIKEVPEEIIDTVIGF